MSKILKKCWYVIQVFSGSEEHVVKSIQECIKIHYMENLFGRIIIPTEEIIELRGKQRRKSKRKFFPGYVLIEMIITNDSWQLVRNTPKVMGFIGGTSGKPIPVSNKEINGIMTLLQKVGDKPRPKVIFELGELIRVREGPFSDFNGVVEEVDYEKNRLKVSVSIFGRSTPIELSFNQVEKN